MGFYTSAYHFYGVHVPEDQWTEAYAGAEGERLDTMLKALKDQAPDVGHISAGAYDQDMLFLCVGGATADPVEVTLGSFRLVTVDNARDLTWDAQLLAVVRAMGYRKTSRPGWITVPDVS